MTQEEKNLLLKDLCTRLPYQVKVKLHDEICTVLGYVDDFIILTSDTPIGQQTNIVNVKPYLRPLSSMTDEEKNELLQLMGRGTDIERVDFYISHHFDYRCLIPMGLALEAPEGMYNN